MVGWGRGRRKGRQPRGERSEPRGGRGQSCWFFPRVTGYGNLETVLRCDYWCGGVAATGPVGPRGRRTWPTKTSESPWMTVR